MHCGWSVTRTPSTALVSNCSFSTVVPKYSDRRVQPPEGSKSKVEIMQFRQSCPSSVQFCLQTFQKAVAETPQCWFVSVFVPGCVYLHQYFFICNDRKKEERARKRHKNENVSFKLASES